MEGSKYVTTYFPLRVLMYFASVHDVVTRCAVGWYG
jgi:hypothetical protein